nr:serine protease [uncultured Methanolobus sp.]
MNTSITEQLVHTTTRIESHLIQGNSVGTGFFFMFKFDDGMEVPVIITNKHVINGGIKGFFRLTKADTDGNPIYSEHETIKLDNFAKQWIPHPNSEVDLCILPIAPILNQNKFFLKFVSELDIPTQDEFNELVAIEDITMIGYPNGLWDSANNMPIVRRGITATHPGLDYMGKSEFIIDASVFPGSSGSPVFLLNIGSYSKKDGGIVIGSRLKCLGITYAVNQHQINGSTGSLYIPNNLGIVIKSNTILDFKPILKKILEQQSAN